MAVRIGVIGCGQIARFHVQGLRATEAQIVALADVRKEKAEALAVPEAEVFGDYAHMLDRCDLDGVVIGVRNDLHHQIASACLDRGLAVFCEKPLTADPRESLDLAHKSRETGAVFMVGFMKRHHTAFRRMQALLAELGPVLHAQIRQCIQVPVEDIREGNLQSQWWGWNRTVSRGGVLVHCGSHELDVLRALVGEPERVTAAFHFVPGLDGMDYDCTAMLEMQKGATALLHITSLPYSKHGPEHGGWLEEVLVYCERGWARLTNHAWNGSMPPELVVYREQARSIETLYTGDACQWENEMQHFVECVRTNSPPTPDVTDGYRVDQIIADAYRSGRENCKVDIHFLDEPLSVSSQ